MSAKSTKKVRVSDRDTLRPEYRREDLGKAVRGKYYKQFTTGTNLVLLSPDVADAFPTADAVNSALRSLMDVASRVHASNKPLQPIARKTRSG
jgi:hypothetical protein